MNKIVPLIIGALVFTGLFLFTEKPVQAQEFETMTSEIEGFGEIKFIPNRVIIRFNPGVQSAEIAQIRQEMNAEHEFNLDLINAEVWSFRDRGMNDVITSFSSHASVDFIQPDIVFDLPDVIEESIEDVMREQGLLDDDGNVPNDQFYEVQWAKRNTGQSGGTPGADISAEQAWAMETGSSDVVIAVLDSGVDYTHPDLAPNMWQNDEGHFGANFAGGDVTDPMDLASSSHGTHVAGTVAAVGNNGIGVAGTMWNAQIMAIRVCGNNGCPQTAIVQGLGFAIENGAMISNNSYGTQTPTSAGPPPAYVAMMEAAQEAGHFFITSAGNSNNNNDILNVYPANLMRDFDNVFSVGNSTRFDTRNAGSCFGAETVHVFAPGTQIASTARNNTYTYLTGTSMASPIVAGIAGLILSANPDADYHFIRDRIMEGVDVLPAFENISISGGRVNAANSVLVDDGLPPATISDLSVDVAGQTFASLSWTAPGNSGTEGRAGSYEIRFSTEPISDSNFDAAELVDGIPRPQAAGNEESYFVRGLEPETQYYFAIRAIDVFGNEADVSNIVTATTDSPSEIDISIASITDEIELDATQDYTFTVTNNGSGTLRYVVPTRMSEEALRAGNPVNALDERFSLTEQADGTESGNPVLFGAGGPDNFGYYWFDDEELQGLTFSWIDISESGEELEFANLSNGHAVAELPFDFPFYGEMKESIGIAINGFASFRTIQTTGSPNNVPLPNNSALPRDLIAPFWTNLVISEDNGGGVFTAYDESAGTFTIQWNNVYRSGDAENTSYTFQAILSESGNITFQYLNMSGDINHATVGVQADNATDALQVAYNSDYTVSMKAVNISSGLPEWFDLAPNTAVIEPGQSVEVTATADASSLVNGIYETSMVFINNDLENPFVKIPVTIEATGGTPDITLSEDVLDFGLVYIDYPETLNVEFTNEGRAALGITSINVDNPAVEISFPEEMEVAALSSVTMSITYNPAEDDLLDTSIILETDDPDNPEIEIALTGEGAGAPDLRLNRNQLFAEVEVDGMVSETMTFRNAGGSDLSYSVSFSETTPGATGTAAAESGETRETDEDLDSTPSWILFVQSQGVLEPAEIREITVRFRGIVEPGEYTADMIISTNDPGTPQRVVQLTMNVVTSTSSDTDMDVPTDFALSQNYPNPFNPTTQIEYAIPEAAHVTLEVFNVQGQRVATLVNGEQSAGYHMATFDAERLSSGVYLYRLTAGSFTQTQKMMLVK
ncbi:MAG: S8 family serine peptidase [Balneolia bacterium]|nr:S8 family serine peptidase [Balneolia bacterium]